MPYWLEIENPDQPLPVGPYLLTQKHSHVHEPGAQQEGKQGLHSVAGTSRGSQSQASEVCGTILPLGSQCVGHIALDEQCGLHTAEAWMPTAWAPETTLWDMSRP